MNSSRLIHAAAWATGLIIALVGATPAHGQVTYVNKVRGSNGNDQCLAVRNGNIANDSTLILWDCIKGDLSQTFWFGTDNLLHVGGPGSKFCVAAYDGVRAGSRVGVWQCQPGNATQSFSAGMYADVIVARTDFCLGVQNASNSPGSPIILWNCNRRGNGDQSWNANRAGTPAAAPQTLPGLAIAPRPSGTTTKLNFQGAVLSSSNLLGLGGYLISQDGGTLVASGGGNYVDSRTSMLVNKYGSPLLIGYQVISNDGGSLVASGGGNLVASGGGNLVASGGGNLISLNNPSLIANIVSASLQQRAAVAIAQPSQVQLAQSATSGIMVNNGGNVYSVQSVKGAPAANTGVCSDAWVTNAIRLVTRRAPNGSGATGECAINRYGGGHWTSYPDLVVKVAQALGWPSGGNCRDAWITQATVEVRGVLPAGSGDTGQCDPRNYNHGQWANYPALVAGVKAYYGLH